MSAVKVKNLHSGDTGGKGWLRRWMEYKDYDTVPFCSNISCINEAVHGGHVIKVGNADKRRYIVPLCADCNENKDDSFEFYVPEDDLVLLTDLS
ncbi:MAG: hypothetical protein IJU48_07215 [Synergistaceae bacterium]|nr:hypothetical protein [Synergistaceae bacterium]